MENWVDPNSQPKEEIQPDAPPIDPNVPQITPVPAQAPPTEVPKPVICKKGKCAPYDPSKDRVSILIFKSCFKMTMAIKEICHFLAEKPLYV